MKIDMLYLTLAKRLRIQRPCVSVFAKVLADLDGIANLQVTAGLYDKPSPMDARAATHKQPQGRKIASLVPEYAQGKTVRTTSQDEPRLSHLQAFHRVANFYEVLKQKGECWR